MSSYVKVKALRVPLAKYGYTDDPYKIESENPKAFNTSYGVNEKYFEVTGTDSEEYYLDYVLSRETDCYGEYGKCRKLYQNEKSKYEGTFKQLLSNINMNDVHLVEYCWYNCSEPMDIYDTTNDPFYEEV